MNTQSATTKSIRRFFGALCTALAVTFAADSTAQVVLPDFTVLVEQNAPAIVFVSTVYAAREGVNASERADLENLLRYFYGEQLELPEPEQPEQRGASGSGFIIEASGYIVTNHHVIDGAETVTVTLNDQREFSATVIGSDERSDLAVLKIEADSLPTVRLGSSENLKVGEWVLAIGSPFGLQYSVAAGIISYMGRSLPATDGTGYVSYIQTDVAINPGHSGGPLFNLAGEVVGINSQIFTDSGGGSIGLSFAIPVDVARNVVSQLRENGAVVRGWMGVGIEDVSQDLADAFNLNAPHGALVNKVIDASPAQAAGFATGDIIIRFNQHDIRTSADLPYFVGLLRPGTEVDVEVIRNGSPQTLKMIVGDLDANAAVSQDDSVQEDISRLGLKVTPLDLPTRAQLGITGGVKVESVRGAAEAARLLPGDIILTLNGIELNSPEDLAALEPNLPADKPLPVLVLRDRGQTFFTIRIGE
jgi:serine protease Do